MLSLLADGEENFIHHWEGNPQSMSVSRADVFSQAPLCAMQSLWVLSTGLSVQWGKFPPRRELFFPYWLVSKMFILETNTLVAKKKVLELFLSS